MENPEQTFWSTKYNEYLDGYVGMWFYSICNILISTILSNIDKMPNYYDPVFKVLVNQSNQILLGQE